MFVAVCTLTQDRFSVVEKTFAALHEYAGCEFHQYVLDYDSSSDMRSYLDKSVHDGLVKYLYHAGSRNVRVGGGYNFLIEKVRRFGGYDAIVLLDHSCLLKEDDTLRRLTPVARSGVLIEPIVDGLVKPKLQIGATWKVDNERFREVNELTGACIVTPNEFWEQFSFPEDMDDVFEATGFLSKYARSQETLMGQLQGLRAKILA